MRLSKKLEQVAGKLQHLQLKLQELEQDKVSLQEENEKLKLKLQVLPKSKTVAIHNILEHAEREGEEKSEGTRAVLDQDIRQQIDHYLSEIDHCIEWLREQ